MKLTDFLQDVGRPVAYYPSLRTITGSATATILLCQLIYWIGKERDTDGWIHKTSDEIEEETGLSYYEQKTARGKLKKANLIKEHYARLEHTLKFKVNTSEVNAQWASSHTHIPECDNPSFGSEETPHSLNESESTTESTTESLSPQKNTANASASESHRAEIERATFEVENSELGVDLPEGLEVGTVKRAWEDCKRLLGWHNLDPIPIGKNLDTIVHWLTHGATGDDLAEAVEWHRDQGYRINHLDRLTNSVMRAKGKRIEAEKESRKYSVGELAN